jgi:NhaP-type Na+/H+ or K+/H+ antiporter
VTVNEIAVIAVFVIAYGLVAARVEGLGLSGPIVFVTFGIVLGNEGLRWVTVELDDDAIVMLVEAALGVVLFCDALRIDVRRLRAEAQLPARLLGIGLPLTIVLGALGALVVFDVGMAEAALIGAILAPTDAALGLAIVSSPLVPVRIRQALNVESGLNDGIALPAVTIFLALAASSEPGTGDRWVRFIAEQIGWGLAVGIGVGLAGGVLVRWCSERGWMAAGYRQLAVAGLVVMAMSVAHQSGGNEFIASFAAGASFGFIARGTAAEAAAFTEQIGQLLAMLIFVVFGASLFGPRFAGFGLDTVVYAVLSLTVIRMIPVSVAMIGAGLRRPTVVFMGWFGPRGLASILFGLIVVEEQVLASDGQIFGIVACTVVVSVFAHGLTAAPAARRYGAWYASTHPLEPHLAESVPMTPHPLGRASPSPPT